MNELIEQVKKLRMESTPSAGRTAKIWAWVTS
jgi:hypothetical protein